MIAGGVHQLHYEGTPGPWTNGIQKCKDIVHLIDINDNVNLKPMFQLLLFDPTFLTYYGSDPLKINKHVKYIHLKGKMLRILLFRAYFQFCAKIQKDLGNCLHTLFFMFYKTNTMECYL